MKGPRLKAEVQSLFEVVPGRSSTDELVFVCPVPGCGDTSGNRSVNLKTGQTNCWRCGKGGPFVKWARKLGYEINDEGVAFSLTEAEELLNRFENSRHEVLIPMSSGIRLPKGFTAVKDDPRSVYYKFIEKMAIKKNLEQADMIKAGVGFTRDDPYWEPFAIFPVLEWGRVVYYQGRMYSPKPGESSKKFPSKKIVPLGSRYWVYNIDRVRDTQARVVIVAESILNVLSLEKKIKELGLKKVVPVAVFKHKLSAPQIGKLLACSSVQEFCLMFDSDATAESWKSAETLINKRKVTVAAIPVVDGRKTNDPNDDVDLAMECFERRKVYTPANSILEMLAKL